METVPGRERRPRRRQDHEDHRDEHAISRGRRSPAGPLAASGRRRPGREHVRQRRPALQGDHHASTKEGQHRQPGAIPHLLQRGAERGAGTHRASAAASSAGSAPAVSRRPLQRTASPSQRDRQREQLATTGSSASTAPGGGAPAGTAPSRGRARGQRAGGGDHHRAVADHRPEATVSAAAAGGRRQPGQPAEHLLHPESSPERGPTARRAGGGPRRGRRKRSKARAVSARAARAGGRPPPATAARLGPRSIGRVGQVRRQPPVQPGPAPGSQARTRPARPRGGHEASNAPSPLTAAPAVGRKRRCGNISWYPTRRRPPHEEDRHPEPLSYAASVPAGCEQQQEQPPGAATAAGRR